MLLSFFTPLFATNTITLTSSYCIDEPYLYVSDLQKESQDSAIILTLPQNATTFKVVSIKLIQALNEFGYDVKDESGGVVVIKQNCYEQEDLQALHVKVEEAFVKAYPTIEILSLNVRPSSQLPKNFKSYMLEDIVLSSSKLRKKSGTFLANFATQNGGVKSLYFTFEIEAYVPIFRAKLNLMQGKVLFAKDYEAIKVALEDIPLKALFFIEPNRWVAKFYIKKGNILTKNRLIEKPTIQKGALVQGILQDDALSIKVEVKALSNGNVGDTIRVRATNGKVFNGIIMDTKRVMIR